MARTDPAVDHRQNPKLSRGSRSMPVPKDSDRIDHQ